MDKRNTGSAAKALAEQILGRDRLAISRAISLAEDSPGFAAELLSELGKPKEPALRLGITGPPGVGKSTIVAGLLPLLLAKYEKAGAILVDPTSPFSGGAVLGDRIRLKEAAESDRVFVRSMASRGSLGGISSSTGAALRILEHWGAKAIVIESVGTGQLGTDIATLADVVFLVLAPGAGDSMQTLKSGILEAADAFIINKADMPGVAALAANLEADARLSDGSPPRIIEAVARTGEGIDALWDEFVKIRASLVSGGDWERRLKMRTKSELLFIVQSLIMENLTADARFSKEFDECVDNVVWEKEEIYSIALKLAERVGKH